VAEPAPSAGEVLPAPTSTTPPEALPRELSPGAIDRRTWHRLQRGKVPISGRLDLHGLSQAEAHTRLVAFLNAQQGRGARCVLVITGRGLRTGGVLKAQTPRWLGTPPLSPLVLAYAPARLGHGGDGALYVLLRRRKG
jgi:DNA-nicking Smr family endonuclease